MNDGGGDRGKEIYHDAAGTSSEYTKKKRSGTDDFGRAIARIAVAQVCEGVGFQSFQQSALDVLSGIAVRYVIDAGKSASMYANMAGRCECNLFDLILALEDLGYTQGFSGASDVNRSISESGIVQEISQYVCEADEIPFTYMIPKFPVFKERTPNPTFLQSGETVPLEHIPPWLPVFPDPSTYSRSHLLRVREPDTSVGISELKRTESSVLNLQPGTALNGSSFPLTADTEVAAVSKRAPECNPFYAPPLQFGEKDVSFVALPGRFSDEALGQNDTLLQSHVPLLEAFAPAIEAVKSGLHDPTLGRKSVLLDNRPAIRLKFGMNKRFLSIKHRIENEDSERTTCFNGEPS